MTPKEFIEKRLNALKTTDTTAPIFKSDEELAEFIFKTIMSKKFRKFSVTPPEYTSTIRKAIENSIKNNLPIKFLWPFGGYKLWRLEETPEADWAELFSLMYFSKWLMSITMVYKPGVEFDFSSDDIIVERMNNIPKIDTEAYARSFKDIINFLGKYLPDNFKFKFTPVGSYYTEKEFNDELNEKIEKMQKELGGLPVLDEKHKKMVELNVLLKPGQDQDPFWREKVELIHQSYYTLSKRYAYTRSKEKILVFTTSFGNCIAIGTTKTSIAKFWPGVGALRTRTNDFTETVLSPSQLKSSQFTKEEIKIEGLNGKNFKNIRIIN